MRSRSPSACGHNMARARYSGKKIQEENKPKQASPPEPKPGNSTGAPGRERAGQNNGRIPVSRCDLSPNGSVIHIIPYLPPSHTLPKPAPARGMTMGRWDNVWGDGG
jgi:hypothetical protein